MNICLNGVETEKKLKKNTFKEEKHIQRKNTNVVSAVAKAPPPPTWGLRRVEQAIGTFPATYLLKLLPTRSNLAT